MYSEITRELYCEIVDIESKFFDIVEKEHFRSYCVASKYGNYLKVVNNYLSATIQYYIIDINA